jgi:tRNA threonylcarbamoyladenosine biosynthesis protein TsaB
MITLGVDTSAQCASVALVREGRLLSECFAHGGQQHSALLLPMVAQCLRQAGLSVAQVDRFAVTNGPGSFTGIRIGAAAVKGMAQALGKPCAGVSTLTAMAAVAGHLPGVLCCAMDARRGQVYAALFHAASQGGAPRRLTEDAALPIAALEEALATAAGAGPVYFLGDGAALCQGTMQPRPGWQLAPEALLQQRGFGAIQAAEEADYRPAEELAVRYLRPSQAERELSAMA